MSSTATSLLQELVDGDFKVEFKEESSDDYTVIIHDKDGTINEEALLEGYGECTADIAAWQDAEKSAKTSRRGIWQSNDD